MTDLREMRVADYPVAARRRRPRSGWFTLMLIVLVLAAIAVVGDRVAARFATEELQTRLVADFAERGVQYDSMNVEVGGFPFLTQVVQGQYESITIDMSNVRLRGATMPTMHVVATGVRAQASDLLGGATKAVADEITGTALVSFASLSNIVDYGRFNLSDVSFTESGGALAAKATASIGTFKVPIAARADLSVVNGALRIKLRDAEAVGVNAPNAVTSYLTGLAQRTIDARLPQLPFSLRLDDVIVQPEGLNITATAREVPLVS
jgi:hypothetical protein